MSQYFCTLDLGRQDDARNWENGCLARGMKREGTVLGMSNGVAAVSEFFAATPDWVYLSGHYNGKGALYAQKDRSSPQLDTIQFERDRITIWSDDGSVELLKDEGFKMHRNVTLLIWGGCSALKDPAQVRMMRELFDNPTILGYTASTSWEINNSMLGGGSLQQHFFANLRCHYPGVHPASWLVDAWLKTARAGYARTPQANMFRGVDNKGRIWDLRGGEIVEGDIV